MSFKSYGQTNSIKENDYVLWLEKRVIDLEYAISDHACFDRSDIRKGYLREMRRDEEAQKEVIK